MNEPEEDPPLFNDLPLDKKYNYILGHNKYLIRRNNLLDEYSKALEHKVNQLTGRIMELQQDKEHKPLRRVRVVTVNHVELVPTPDVIGETLELRKRLSKVVERNDQLNKELQALKKVIKHRR